MVKSMNNATENEKRVALYFIASPLHYLAAKSIARHFEKGAKQILVYIKKEDVESHVEKEAWDEILYMPWPRHDPLPGPLGRMRRIRENLYRILRLIEGAYSIHVHAHEYDNEALNYFVDFLPNKLQTDVRFRILPDGVANLSYHPLSPAKYLWHCLRKTRRLLMPELNYRCFKGDRFATQADFVDRIYTLPGFSCPYDKSKVAKLPNLVEPALQPTSEDGPKRALVIGGYMVDVGQTTAEGAKQLKKELHAWLRSEGVEKIDFKPHPKDKRHELKEPSYRIIRPDAPLELYMAKQPYDYIVSVHSTALFTARQIYPETTRVVSFGIDKVRFKSETIKENIITQMKKSGIEIVSAEKTEGVL